MLKEYLQILPVDAYRGAGRPETTYVTERLVEYAQIVDIDSIQFEKNFIQMNFIRHLEI